MKIKRKRCKSSVEQTSISNGLSAGIPAGSVSRLFELE
uniref:Uncharacterized protein n=1 Tax=Nelumbo nucifera TaxID=4432 RepID=A0A822Y9S3_NELNU|nr:TPA_asm: hypothetical protein HUJ06_029477 [Nelumbo nucifera]